MLLLTPGNSFGSKLSRMMSASSRIGRLGKDKRRPRKCLAFMAPSERVASHLARVRALVRNNDLAQNRVKPDIPGKPYVSVSQQMRSRLPQGLCGTTYRTG